MVVFWCYNLQVKYIGGSIFSLEFQNNEDGYNLTRVDYKKSVEQGVEIETGSNHVGDGFDSSRDNVEPLGTTLKCETPNEVVQDGSEEEPSYAAGNFSEKDGGVDAGEASPFPAHSHKKDNLNFELGYGSDSYVEKKGHLTMAVDMVKEMGPCHNLRLETWICRLPTVGKRGLSHLARNYTARPRKRDAAFLHTELLIAQKEEAGIQLQAEEFDFMAAAGI
ncbi:hypothetical protein Tco_1510908 [Tanacetum coccineum]